jgi:putative ABC transport system permease protein
MLDLTHDLRLAGRGFSRRPGFALLIVLTLALGIAANATVFSFIDALLLRPFPIPDVDRVAALFETLPARGVDRDWVAPADFFDWRENARSFERLAAYRAWDVNLTGVERPERLQGTLTTPALFEVLGVSTDLGRTLASDGVDSREPAVVLSRALWRERFAADPAVVGSAISLGGDAYTVVGVAPEGFEFPDGSQLWAPLRLDAKARLDRDHRDLRVLGRLEAGATVEGATRELRVIATRLAELHPETNAGCSARAVPLAEGVADVGASTFLALWQATAFFVLLIGGINVASLLLARGPDQASQLSLQLALGARRRRIVRQLLTEHALLATLAAFVALPLVYLALRTMKGSMPARIARSLVGWDQIDVDLRVLLLSVLLAVGTTLAFGMLPALRASSPDLARVLAPSRSTEGPRRQSARSVLIAAEVAVALALLVASTLSIRGSLRMIEGPRGYDPDHLATLTIALPEGGYRDETDRIQFFEEVLRKIRPAPGVIEVAAAAPLPSSGSNVSRPVEIEGRPAATEAELPRAAFRVVSPSFFSTLRIPLLAGRAFDQGDRAGTLPVTVASRAMATRLWPGEDPLGHRFRIGRGDQEPWLTVVGVADEVVYDWFLGPDRPAFYVPLAQHPPLVTSVAIRTVGDDLTPTIATARAAVLAVDPDQPIYDVGSQRRRISDRTIGLRYAASVMAVFGTVALILAAVGIYGLMTYAVSQRTREIGVRVALGARRGHVLRATVGRALAFTGIGIGVGLALAVAAARLMASSLFGVVVVEPEAFLLAGLVLLATSLIAAWLPARRALAVDPALALRFD